MHKRPVLGVENEDGVLSGRQLGKSVAAHGRAYGLVVSSGFGIPAFNANTRRWSVRRVENGTRNGAGLGLAQGQQATPAQAADNWQETHPKPDRTGIIQRTEAQIRVPLKVSRRSSVACADTLRNMDDPRTNPMRPRRAHDFEASYTGTPPWDIGRPQPAFLALAEAGALRGRVLDVGCGTGEHALMAAGFGLEAAGIDSAAAAIAIAERKARERGLAARFLVWNALGLASLGEQFDTALDCGLYHVFSDEDRRSFVDNLTAVVRPGGRYFMLCFSERQPGDTGPRRVAQAEIRASFDRGWQVDSIEPATIEITIGPGIVAWLACLTRV